MDGAGNVYVTGRFNGAADFDPGAGTATLTPVGGSLDIFVAKYDPSGNYVWAISMGGSDGDFGTGVAVDGAGNVYVTGTFQASADFDPGAGTATLNSAGEYDVFVAKYDSNGNYVWAMSIGSSNADLGQHIAVDRSGNVFVTGYFQAAADFDPGAGTATLTPAGELDVFVAKYDPNGNYVWAKSMGGSEDDIGYRVAVDGSGSVYVAGYFRGSADFDPGAGTAMLTSVGWEDVFVAKYDSNGNYAWAKSMGGTATDIGYGVAVDGAGNVYVTGYFNSSTAAFGTTILTRAGGFDMFVAKYDPNGNFVWAENMGGSNDDQGLGAAVDGAGNVYVTGYFNSPTADFDPGAGTATLTRVGGYDVFAAKYDPNGNYVWAESMGSSNDDFSYGVAVDGSGNVYMTGSFRGPMDFDPGAGTATLTPEGGNDVFVLKLGCGDTTSSYLAAAECGVSYTLNGEVYTASGIYTQHFPNTAGCDSTVTLELTLHQIDDPVVTVDTFVLGVSGTYVTYQWIDDNGDIPGATNPTYTVTANGRYSVRVTDDNGCEAASGVYEVTNVSVSDINGLARQIRIHPNPANDMVYISSPVHVNLSVYSIEGRNLLHETHTKAIDVRELAQGTYLLRITDQDGRLIKVEKISKQ